MTVEVASYISDFNEAYPRNKDLINEGDDHLRLIKNVLKNTFPGIDGTVQATAEKLNKLDTTFQYDEDSVITVGNVLDMNEKTIKNLPDPEDAGDAVPLSYLQSVGAWPVGSIFMTVDSRNPKEIFGFGTWVEFAAGRVIVGTGQNTDSELTAKTFVNEATGGVYESKLAVDHLPEHAHVVDLETAEGGEHTHNNGYFVRSDGNASNMPYGMAEAITGWSSIHTYEHHKYYSLGPEVGQGITGKPNALHKHVVKGDTSSVGAGKAFENTQPWIAVNIWKRTE